MVATLSSILYLTLNEDLNSQESGVSRKLLSKVTAIKNLVSKCILLNANTSVLHNEIKLIEKNDLFVNIEIGVKKANIGYLNKIKCDKLFYTKLANFIKDNEFDFERIIFRYPYASLGLQLFANLFHKKIVFEHNTKEIEELNTEIGRKNYAPFSVRPSQFFFWLQEKKYPIYCERFVSKHIFAAAHSGSCVTTEIAKYEQKRNSTYKTFVSSNFYDVNSVALSENTYKKGDLLVFGMIVTTTASWYGLDRLLKSFSRVQDKYKLIIAGIDENDRAFKKMIEENKIKKNLTCLGKINKEQLTNFYNSVHACFGSLGLYTINLKDASTLKVKESVSFGVPVIVGYNEEDFIYNKEFEPYYLQLKNDSSIINFDSIQDFVYRFYSDPQHKKALRNLALKYMDVNVKINLLLKKISD